MTISYLCQYYALCWTENKTIIKLKLSCFIIPGLLKRNQENGS